MKYRVILTIETQHGPEAARETVAEQLEAIGVTSVEAVEQLDKPEQLSM